MRQYQRLFDSEGQPGAWRVAQDTWNCLRPFAAGTRLSVPAMRYSTNREALAGRRRYRRE